MAQQPIKKLLARRLPSSTSDALLYAPRTSTMIALVSLIVVCNTTAASKTYSIWNNTNGVVSADGFALIKGLTLAANATDQYIYPVGAELILTGSSASIIVAASVANAVNFMIYGTEIEQV